MYVVTFSWHLTFHIPSVSIILVYIAKLLLQNSSLTIVQYMAITSKMLLQVKDLTNFPGLRSSVNWLLHKALVTGSELLEWVH